MDQEELRAWLRLVLTPRIGPGSARKLLAALGSPQAIFDAGDEALQALLGKRERAALAAVPPELDTQFETLLTWLATSPSLPDGGCARQVLCLADALYPSTLLQAADPPLLLFA